MNPADHPTSDPREQPISRYELWAVVAITLLGAAVRFAFPSAMAIEHFDEGVYASNLLFPDQDYRYPAPHLSPPPPLPSWRGGRGSERTGRPHKWMMFRGEVGKARVSARPEVSTARIRALLAVLEKIRNIRERPQHIGNSLR